MNKKEYLAKFRNLNKYKFKNYYLKAKDVKFSHF